MAESCSEGQNTELLVFEGQAGGFLSIDFQVYVARVQVDVYVYAQHISKYLFIYEKIYGKTRVKFRVCHKLAQ